MLVNTQMNSHPNLDGIGGGSAQPVSVGREAQGVDDVARIEGVQVLVVVQVPEHSLAVFASRSAQRTVWRNSHRVQVAVVAEVVGLQLAVGQVPDLHGSVPAARDDDRVGDVRRESHARYPITVRILLKIDYFLLIYINLRFFKSLKLIFRFNNLTQIY